MLASFYAFCEQCAFLWLKCQQFYNQKETTCSRKIHVLVHVGNGFMDKIWYPDSAWKLGVIAATLTTMVAFLY